VNGAGNSTLPIERISQPASSRSYHDVRSRGARARKLLVTVNGQDLPVSQPGAIGPDAGAAGFTIGSREDILPGSSVLGGPTWPKSWSMTASYPPTI
jgi:hypothetical protein